MGLGYFYTMKASDSDPNFNIFNSWPEVTKNDYWLIWYDLIVLRMAVLFGCASVGYDGLCIDIYGLVLVVLYGSFSDSCLGLYAYHLLTSRNWPTHTNPIHPPSRLCTFGGHSGTKCCKQHPHQWARLLFFVPCCALPWPKSFAAPNHQQETSC